MATKEIYDYLDELSRCEWDAMAEIASCSYNGFSISEGAEIYQQKLKTMQREAEESLLDMSIAGQQQALNAFHEKAKEICEQVDDVITPEYVEGLRADARGGSRTQKIQDEIDKGQFIVQMHGIQCYFRNELLNFISRLKDAPMAVTDSVIPTQTQIPAAAPVHEPKPSDENITDDNEKIIKGVSGLAKFLNCGKTKAQAIINSKVLEKNKIQWYCGGWQFNAKLLREFMNSDPTAFKNIKCSH